MDHHQEHDQYRRCLYEALSVQDMLRPAPPSVSLICRGQRRLLTLLARIRRVPRITITSAPQPERAETSRRLTSDLLQSRP